MCSFRFASSVNASARQDDARMTDAVNAPRIPVPQIVQRQDVKLVARKVSQLLFPQKEGELKN